MFCPLCKAEFRNGFTQCSDCHIPLVATKQEADTTGVARVWKGGNKSEFESVLSGLQTAGVPLLFREHLNVAPAVRTSLLNRLLLPSKRQQVYDTAFEIKVLERDARRAAEAVRRAVPEDKDEDSNRGTPA